MTLTRTRAAVAAVAFAAALPLAGVAWACTAAPQAFSSRPQSGPAGTAVTVSGSGWQDGSVEIRWNGESGTVLGTASGPNFSHRITIPNVEPRTYTIVAVQRDGEGSPVMRASTAFAVTKPAASSTPTTAAPAESAPSNPQPSASQPSQPAPATASPAPASSGTKPGATAARQTTTTVRRAAAPATTQPESPTAPAEESPAPAPAEAATTEDVPAAATAAADVWSGFTDASRVTRGPGLVGDVEGSSGGTAWLGVGLLAAGTAALLGTSSVVLVRRRRAHAGATGDPAAG